MSRATVALHQQKQTQIYRDDAAQRYSRPVVAKVIATKLEGARLWFDIMETG